MFWAPVFASLLVFAAESTVAVSSPTAKPTPKIVSQYRTGVSASLAVRLADVSVRRVFDGGYWVGAAVGWWLDAKLCDVIEANSSHCFGQRWMASVPLGYDVSLAETTTMSIFFEPGLYSRSAREKSEHPVLAESALYVYRSERGIAVTPGVAFLSNLTEQTKMGIELGVQGSYPFGDEHLFKGDDDSISRNWEPTLSIAVQRALW